MPKGSKAALVERIIAEIDQEDRQPVQIGGSVQIQDTGGGLINGFGPDTVQTLTRDMARWTLAWSRGEIDEATKDRAVGLILEHMNRLLASGSQAERTDRPRYPAKKNPGRGGKGEPGPAPEVRDRLDKARVVLESGNRSLVAALSQNIDTFYDVVMPAHELTSGQAFDLVARKLVFFCMNPACGKEVGRFTSREELSDVCPFCGEPSHAKTFAQQIEAIGGALHETDDVEEIRRKIETEIGDSAPGKSQDLTHK